MPGQSSQEEKTVVSAGAGLVDRIRPYRFFALFVVLIFFLLMIPAFDRMGHSDKSYLARFVDLSVFALVYVTIALCIPGRNHVTIIVRALVGISILSVLVDVFIVHTTESLMPRAILAMLLMAYMAYQLLKVVVTTTTVTLDTIFASLCAYLLMGVIWAELYVIVLHLDPEALSLPDHISSATQMSVGSKGSTAIVYYSFVTLTTLGYGDMTPKSPMFMMLSVLEAAVGQIYMTVLVARLVGLHIANTRPPKSGST